MNVTCPECRSLFRVDPAKVPSAGVRARCSICGGVITIGAGTSIDEEFDSGQAIPSRASAESAGAARPAVQMPTPPNTPYTPSTQGSPDRSIAEVTIARVDVQTEQPALVEAGGAGLHASAQQSAQQAVEVQPSMSPTPTPSLTPASPAAAAIPERASTPAAEMAPAAPPAVSEPSTSPKFPPPPVRPPAFSRAPLTPPASVPAITRTGASGSALPPIPPARPPFGGRQSGTGPLATVRPPGGAPPLVPPNAPRTGAELPSTTQSGAQPRATTTRTPINPFLANDPNAKARRLSRALISDLVTYFPERREEGIRDGNLKELFRDEIKKSYEEYVEQVGRDLADSTTHFKDALNEILAAGKNMF